MKKPHNARLIPTDGGEPIPLIRPTITLGRRQSCDICLAFPNVSALHCELTFNNGHWMIRDLGSTNGTKVNGTRVQKKVLRPKDIITIGKRKYTIDYVPEDETPPDVAGVPVPRPSPPGNLTAEAMSDTDVDSERMEEE